MMTIRSRAVRWQAVAGLLALLLAWHPPSAGARDRLEQAADHAFRIVTLVEGLVRPWSLAFLPGGDMLVTERPGRLRRIAAGRLDPSPIAGVPAVAATGQGGLLDVALHPEFAANRLIYLSYSASGPRGAATRVARGRLTGNRLTDLEVIFEALPYGWGGRHFGSRLLFDRQGDLFVTTGERGDRPRAQRLDDLAGKTVRLRDDGAVPPDNPFLARPGARPEIYSYGHRNAQGMALHPVTGRVWLHEHGPQGGDEVNILRPGVNYGWPVITHGRGYDGSAIGVGSAREGLAPPQWHWTPSIAPSGMAFYDGAAFPRWRGSLFVGALRARLLSRLSLEGDRVVAEERLLHGLRARIRDVRQGPDGMLYLLTDHRNGKLLRLEPAD